jgi:hypothetical protein
MVTKGMEWFQIWYASREYLGVVLANHIKEEHWICDKVVAREGSDIVCFL